MPGDVVAHVVEHVFDATLLDPAIRIAAGFAQDEVVKLVGPQRMENLTRLAKRVREKLSGKPAETPPLSVSVPLLEAARDESRDGLLDLWADLLAAAADPTRAGSYRAAFLEIVRGMDPIDTKLITMPNPPKHFPNNEINEKAAMLGITRDQFEVSIENLIKLGVLFKPNSSVVAYSALGREFCRVILSDGATA
ncbi:MAG: DUF4393 domain-containing protein [Pseudomonadota bacterium]|nr:DUF4393 domain-containing protein [Pseudomonadota bacterium]